MKRKALLNKVKFHLDLERGGLYFPYTLIAASVTTLKVIIKSSLKYSMSSKNIILVIGILLANVIQGIR